MGSRGHIQAKIENGNKNQAPTPLLSLLSPCLFISYTVKLQPAPLLITFHALLLSYGRAPSVPPLGDLSLTNGNEGKKGGKLVAQLHAKGFGCPPSHNVCFKGRQASFVVVTDRGRNKKGSALISEKLNPPGQKESL